MSVPQDPGTVGTLGEFGIIARLSSRLHPPPPPAGPGDDAAVVPAPDGRVVATTDLLAEGVHFRLDWSSPYEIGRKAAAVNLSDVAAMGAIPTALLVGVALPASTPVAVIDGLADGLRDECARVGAVIVGGDTIASSDRITLAVTALGDLQGRAPVTRAAALPGRLVLAGELGYSAGGLALLQADSAAGGSLLTTERRSRFAELLTAHRTPAPPYAMGPVLAALGALAMCDVSDGLLADLGHLVDACDGGARLAVPALGPDLVLLEAAALVGADPWDWVLNGGEDHGLLAVLPKGTPAPAGTRLIGRLEPGTRRGVALVGRTLPVFRPGGHDHFPQR